ncbi:hypothetical protein SCUCBS95973_008040 [Sporothrix curviconia]|uniref:Uncharacterized protein n=1 Tax=Sporothrix curviconia TaxID=1260050 RepID=A0ABP0CI72_9PEZI
MGLMTLLTRKINPDKQPQVRAPTYERKASTKSPVRLVQTVSPNSTISRSHSSPEVPKPNSRDIKARRYSSSPLSQASFSIDSAAPAPVVLGFRGDETPSRPNASTHKLEADAQRMEILPGPSAALPRPSLWLSQLMTPRSRASLILTPEPAATATARAQQRSHRSQSSISSSKLAKSIRSVNGKGHVDLLDAQSEFKPLDFHSRVKAAGTRDYGEDVADRNIGVNGCNLDSQPVQAYYAVRPRTSIRATALDQRRPFSAWNRRPDFSDDEDDTMCYTHVVKQSSIESALWSNSINSSHPAFYGNEQSQSVLDGAALQKHLALRRQSYNAARAVPPLDAHGTPSLAEIEALHEQQRLLSKKARSHSLQVAAQDANKLVSVWDTTSPESELSSSSARPSTSGSKSRRLHASRKDGAGAAYVIPPIRITSKLSFHNSKHAPVDDAQHAFSPTFTTAKS